MPLTWVEACSQVLACDATLGYEDTYNVQLRKFNGQAVVNLRHLIQLITDCDSPYMRFDLDHDVRPMLRSLHCDCLHRAQLRTFRAGLQSARPHKCAVENLLGGGSL